MKTTRLLKTTIFLMLFVIGMLFNGCANDNPVAMSTDNTANGKNITFLRIFDNSSLNKVTTASSFINDSTGGNLHLEHYWDGDSTAPYVIVDLNVPALAIDFSKTISVSFDDADNVGEADLVFGPHGTQYSSPALLTMECGNFDLTGIDTTNLNFYYVNENGVWEEHPCEAIIVDPVLGLIRVINAQLPHFSRYAIGME